VFSVKPSPGPRGLRHSTLWNGGAQVAPVASAAIAIPFLSRGLGEERLGLLLLAWTVVSMVSVLDLGVGRALTQMIAVRRSGGRSAELRSIATIGVRISGISGLAAGLLLIALSGWITSALGAEGGIQREASVAVVLVALGLPFLLVANAFRATLDGLERFDLSARARIPTGSLTFLLPAALVPFTQRLDVAVGALVAVRCVGGLVLGVMAARSLPDRVPDATAGPSPVRELLHLGGWVSVGNLASMILVYADRFIIASFVSIAAIAHYATASEVVTKLLIGPIAVAGVWFPALARTGSPADGDFEALAQRGIRLVTALIVPALVTLIVLADPVLRLWAGLDGAWGGVSVLRYLAIGVFLNAIAQIPFSTLHARARPDVVARLHVLQLPLYFALLGWALPRFALVGAAISWTIRSGADMLCLLVAATRVEPGFRAAAALAGILAFEGVLLLSLSIWIAREVDALSISLLMVPISGAWVWGRVLTPAWRDLILTQWPRSGGTD